MRSAFVQWPLLLRRGGALLADLREHTPIDTLELSDFTLDWEHSEPAAGDEAPAQLALPESDYFDGVPFAVPVADAEEYGRLAGAVAAASAGGFKIACNVTPFYIGSAEAARFTCLDADLRAIPCIRSNLECYGCASNPEVIAYAEAMARAFIAAWPALDVLTINHAEYPLWPQRRPEELLVCFCDACRERATARGLDLEPIRAELAGLAIELRERCSDGAPGSVTELLVSAIERPSIAAWLQFRRDAVSECVERVVAAARDEAIAVGKDVSIGLEMQLPALAPLVGTDFPRLADGLDFLVAKFPDYLSAAVLPGLSEALAGAEDPQLIAGFRELLGVGPGPERYRLASDANEGIRYANAFDPSVFDLQLPRLEPVRGAMPVHAYLWKYGGDSADLRGKVGAVQERGFDGYCLWVWNRDLDERGPQEWSLPPSDREGVV